MSATCTECLIDPELPVTFFISFLRFSGSRGIDAIAARCRVNKMSFVCHRR